MLRRGLVGTLAVVAGALAAVSVPAAQAQAPPDPRAEASALARIALDTRAKLRERAPLVDSGLKQLDRFLARCPALERASHRAPREDIEALGIALSSRFLNGPLLGTLNRFAGELEAAAVTDSALRGGVVGWRAAVESLQTFVRLPDRVCAAVRRWSRSGYTHARAPVDADAIAAADKRTERAVDVIDRASRRLRALGASADAAKAFSIDGLFEALVEAVFPDEVGETGEGSSGSPVRRERLR